LFFAMTHPLSDHIDTARLRLRKPKPSDARAIFQAYTQDREVCHFMTWTPHASESATEAFMEWCVNAWNAGSCRPYMITERGEDVAIGMIDARMLGTTIDIGYVVASQHWGKGFVPEAITALSSRALESPGIFRVQATCDVENLPSQRALEKAGFTREGRLERYIVHPNISPEPRACLIYARVR
jgi:ribosomal-protein-alanine N-acetyltransferase